jgi:hypothetical protein
MHIPNIPQIAQIEAFVVRLIVLILLIFGGARLVLHEWHALKEKRKPKRRKRARKVLMEKSP